MWWKRTELTSVFKWVWSIRAKNRKAHGNVFQWWKKHLYRHVDPQTGLSAFFPIIYFSNNIFFFVKNCQNQQPFTCYNRFFWKRQLWSTDSKISNRCWFLNSQFSATDDLLLKTTATFRRKTLNVESSNQTLLNVFILTISCWCRASLISYSDGIKKPQLVAYRAVFRLLARIKTVKTTAETKELLLGNESLFYRWNVSFFLKDVEAVFRSNSHKF